jgi:hypothetical protein
MDFLFPETERKISSRWSEDEMAEADEVVASIGKSVEWALLELIMLTSGYLQIVC